MRRAGSKPLEASVRRVIADADYDGSGTVSYEAYSEEVRVCAGAFYDAQAGGHLLGVDIDLFPDEYEAGGMEASETQRLLLTGEEHTPA